MTKKSRRVAKARRALLALSLVLVTMLVAVGGTIAWLTASTESVVNTFTGSNVAITLTETTTEYKMVPGSDIDKNPKVAVSEVSEDAWIFVKIEKSTDLAFDTYLTYTVADDWTKLKEENNVAYYGYNKVLKAGETAVSVLAGDKVSVKTSVTKEQMDAVNSADETKQPKLTFTAYAIQSANIPGTGDAAATVTDAWNAYTNQNAGN